MSGRQRYWLARAKRLARRSYTLPGGLDADGRIAYFIWRPMTVEERAEFMADALRTIVGDIGLAAVGLSRRGRCA